MLADVDHVQLAAPPGFPKPPLLAARGGCWFRAGAVELHLGIEEGFTPARKAHPWDEGLPGRLRFYSRDPVGNRLEFLV
ncbi:MULTISPECIES: hypothetical protein [Streptomyces]|nr:MULTISPECIES: hypothetical protein [Streptomyces]MYT06390.1 hypothetical protein [Streptomyces sp. SID5470]